MSGSEKKRILFIMPSLAGGGAEKVLVDILRHFDQSKYTVTLLLLYRSGVYLKNVPVGINVISPSDLGQRAPRYVVNRHTVCLWHRYLFRRLCGRTHFDAIISFMEGKALRFHSSVFKYGKKNISWVHIDLKFLHWSLKYFKNQNQELNAYRKLDSTVFVSERSCIKFKELFGQECNPKVILNLIDSQLINKKGSEECDLKKERFTIVNVGRLCQQKRQDRLIEAIALLKSKYRCEIDLWLLGVGDLKDNYAKLASELGVTSNVKFLGFQDNPYKYIKEADVFVLSSETEGYPLVLCEALCLSKPVVSTKVTGALEILEGDAGILVEETPQALAEAIYSLATSPSKLSLYSERAKNRSEIFVPERTMEEIYRLFE